MIQEEGLPDIKPRSFDRLNLITPSIAAASENGRVESVVSHQVTIQALFLEVIPYLGKAKGNPDRNWCD